MAFDRRAFVKSISAGAIGVGAAWPALNLSTAIANSAPQEPPQTTKSPVFNLGLAAYSFKPHFEFYKGKKAKQKPLGEKSIDMFGFIDYCAGQKCAAELTSYFFPPDADEKYFQKIKRHAFVNGVPIAGTAIGNNFTIPRGKQLDKQIADAKLWIDRAAQMGAPHIRFFAGKRAELEADPDRMKIAIESLQTCVDYAAQYGIFIGVENHGKLNAAQVIQVVKGVKSDWFGVNLDTGNFVEQDPYAELVKCAPHAVNVQVKIKMKNDAGVKHDADLARVAKIFTDANYRGNVVMEYEEEKPFENVPAAMDLLRKHFGG
jgi:sugar phosphate isomerase/epimerase